MNWKNVIRLVRIERKSGRLLRGVKKTHYHESGIMAYWPYWVAAVIGIIATLLINWGVSAIYADPEAVATLPSLSDATLGFYTSIPTFILLLSVVFSMLQQIQLSGIKKTTQPMYWLPVTWQENTLASILSNLFGFPLAMVAGFAAGIILFGALNGFIIGALLATLGMLAAAFMGSALTEIVRILQVRFTGAVYKSSGRAAVYVRLIGSLLFFVIFYIIYFTLVTGNGLVNFISTLSTFQTTIWYVPFVWAGTALYYIFNSEIILALAFIAATALFLAGLYYAAVKLNQRFGLYEPPAIRVQTSGKYVAKSGALGKFGFTSIEAAIIRKDIKAFTRRRELMSIFILPIVFIILCIFNSMNLSNSGAPNEVNIMFEAMIFLFPAAIMAMSTGNMMIGEEGPAVWRIYASPISAKNLVKSKYAFIVILSIIALAATGAIGVIFFQPSLNFTIAAFAEAIFLTFALAAIGLSFGFKGADFTVTMKPRMIRQEWALISFVVCALSGLAILAPLIPYILIQFAGPILSLPPLGTTTLAILLAISGVIAAVFTAIFYKINLDSATELLRKAET